MELHLSFIPPSVNACYGNNKGGRHKTKRYKEWCAVASRELIVQKRNQFIAGPFVCQIVIDIKKWRKNADIDNRIKPTLDLLQTLGFIADDCFSRDVRIRLDDIDSPMKVYLEEYQERDAA